MTDELSSSTFTLALVAVLPLSYGDARALGLARDRVGAHRRQLFVLPASFFIRDQRPPNTPKSFSHVPQHP